jgi:hypothetical protein
MALRKFLFASSRCSAGDDTEGEFASALVLWERPERPRVNSEGRIAMLSKLWR